MRKRTRLVTNCDGCGKPFMTGDRIDVVREAKVDGPFYIGGQDRAYRLMSKPPLAIFHKECTPGA
jgi:hypothetical protein